MECPHPHKRQFKSNAKARRAMRKMKKKNNELHTYRCPSDEHFHIGSNRKREAYEIYVDLYWKGTGDKDE